MFQKLNLINKACVFRLTKQEKPNGEKKNKSLIIRFWNEEI